MLAKFRPHTECASYYGPAVSNKSLSGPTPQQKLAIDASGVSVVLSSGAGCGKTAVLTDRYLEYLRRGKTKVSEIVAITFTDRAAREMRRRIREKLERVAKDQPNDPRWTDHLNSLESASIQTIHSFCSDLLRRFAVQAGLDPQFDVLEEILADNLRVESLRDTLQTLLTAETPVGEDLCELIVLYGWSSVLGAVRGLMKERDVAAWTMALQKTPAEITKEWAGKNRDELRRVWIDYLLSASPKITHLVNLFETVECLGPIMRGNVQTVLDGLDKLATTSDLPGLVEQITEAAKVGKERATAWPEDEYDTIREAMTGFRSSLKEKLALFLEEPEDLSDAALVGQRFLRVTLAVVEAYQKRKSNEGVVDFQDLLVLARDLVRDSEEVRANLQDRFRFLLLDEMQDTDPVQMELIELICGDSIQEEKLFAVGDAKQSIYRFRGADVALFEKLRASVPPKGRLSLTRNFRSQAGILHFVNALCSRRFDKYEPLEPHIPQKYAGESVEFLWSVPSPGEDAEKESVAQVRAREADTIARRIRELRADGELRVVDQKTNDLRKVELRDIVLLYRSMSNVGIYEAALRRHDLNYYLVGGRAFFAQQEVYDLLNLLRTLENPGDAIALAGTLRSPFGCLSDDALFLLALHRDGLWVGLHDSATIASLPADQRPRAERIRDALGRWRAQKDRLPIARLINLAVADTGYDAALQFESLGERKLANLWKLIDLARTFDATGMFGLAEFIARLGELVSTQPREEQAATEPEESDVIRIMSIHQAKGLEFPVVFVPDFAAKQVNGGYAAVHWHRKLGCVPHPPDEDPPLFSKYPVGLMNAFELVADWREDLRVLYVASTRARDLLILSGGLKEAFPEDVPDDQPVPVKAANSGMLALGERFNLVSGICLDTKIAASVRPRVRARVVEPVAP